MTDTAETGWQLVPKEPTPAMFKAGEHAWMNRNLRDPKSEPIADCYRAMLAASPPSPAVMPGRPVQHWGVTVTVNGVDVLTIESNFLSGSEFIGDYENEVETAARHLLSFIGKDGALSPQSDTYTHICRNEKCPLGGRPLTVIADQSGRK